MARDDQGARLVKLSDTDLTLEDPAQDIRGRDVYDREGNRAGIVEDLYVDRRVGEVRFLTIASGATSALRGTVAGLLNGLLVWALGVVLILGFSAFGVGQVFGALGNLFSQFRALVIIPESSPQAIRQVADAIASGAFAAFLSMLLPAIAAALGGWLGAKTASREGDRSTNARTVPQR